MRTNSFLRRLEALELELKPPARLFVFNDMVDDPASYEERLAAFRVANGVGPEDKLLSVRVTYS